MKKILASLICYCFISTAIIYAQSDLDADAPTLQLGLDGFSFAKGTLDAQLIMEIVAEKQQDLKIKAIQNVFLSKVQNAGGTIYSFTDNVVRQLVFEPDQDVRTRKIMENTVNLVFVGTYVSFYLASLDNDDKLKVTTLYNYYQHYKGFSSDSTTEIPEEELTLNNFSKGNSNESKWDQKGIKLSDEKYSIGFIALLIDMSSLVIRENKELQNLGLMQLSYSESYEHMNLYNQLHLETNAQLPKNNKDKKLVEEKNGKLEQLKDQSKIVKEDMQVMLKDITNCIGVVNYMIEQKTFRFETGGSFFKADDATITSNSYFIDKAKSIKTEVKLLIDSLRSDVRKDSLLDIEIKNLTDIYYFIDKASVAFSDSASSVFYGDILYTFSHDFIPILKEQTFRDEKYFSIIDNLMAFNENLFKNLSTKNPWLADHFEKIPDFLVLASNLYEFDESSTLSEYMNLLDDIALLFPDNDITNALSMVMSFVKDYTVIEENENGDDVLTFNVQSYLYRLQAIKPHKLQRVQFHFTVGLNNTMFIADKVPPVSGESIRNLSYVGEKIGIKIKIYDRAFWMTRNPGETYQIGNRHYTKLASPYEPILSNVHFLMYGSGLLYNLVDSKTSKEFDMPLFGTGFGMTFYNGLDLNLSIGVPITPNESFSLDYHFLNVGFDIQFVEYYNRLNEKRKNNQVQKKFTEAID